MESVSTDLPAHATLPNLLPLAPNGPGIAGRWTSSAKSAVGTALSALSRVWFTLSHGIVNEVYYPRVDMACIRDMGLLITGPDGYAVEEKRSVSSVVTPIEPGIPVYDVVNTSIDGRWRIHKRILTDPLRDTLLHATRFEPLVGKLEDYRVFVLLAPHLVNKGAGNTGWLDSYKGREMLFAEGGDAALGLASTVPWLARSAGFVGASDGWHDVMETGGLVDCYARAENGNVALIGEIDLNDKHGEFALALSFGRRSAEAGWRAVASLHHGIDEAVETTSKAWRDWQSTLEKLDRPDHVHHTDLYRHSTAVLRTHVTPSFLGGYIASLSIPWGFNKGDEDLGGYHLVWPRDLVETAGGFLAAGALEEARQVMVYLEATQEETGGWSQNMWLDGTPYWTGQQMDESAFPILLSDMLRRAGGGNPAAAARFWPMIRRAAAFIVRNGPVTGQDRWEEDGGFSPFTLAVEIAALLVAAERASEMGEPEIADYLTITADSWNDDIERWTYVEGGALAERLGVEGYYVRIGSPDTADAASPAGGYVPIKNRPVDQGEWDAAAIVSPDALALVRFGLRSAADAKMRATIMAIDALLRVDLPQGPLWYRYNEDGYGEHEDGSAFDGTGVGRAWPLLVGERAHYELAEGDMGAAEALLITFEKSAGDGGLFPEQIWDKDDIPERELFRGRPSGSAMPLVWAHSEYIKLLRSLRDGRVFDMPEATYRRYVVDKVPPTHALWSRQIKRRTIRSNRTLRLVLTGPTRVHWSGDGWKTVHDTDAAASGLGTYFVDIAPDTFASYGSVVFTLYDLESGSWEGADYQIAIES